MPTFSAKDTINDIALIPSEIFFTKTFFVEEGSSMDEIRNLAEMELETLSPFPLDQLAWAFYRYSPTQALLYACTLKLAQKSEAPIREDFEQVYPSFIPLLIDYSQAKKDAKKSVLGNIIHYNDSVSILQESQDGNIAINSVKVSDEDKNEEDIVDHIKSIFPSANVKGSDICYLKDIFLKNKNVFFSVENQRTGKQEVLSLNRTEKWNADLRDSSFRVEEQKRRRNSVLSMALIQVACIFIVIGGLVYGGNYLAKWKYEKTNEEIASKRPALNYLNARANIINLIDSTTEVTLQPFKVLDEINKVRPNGLYFTQVRAKGKNEVSVEGVGIGLEGAIKVVNDFADKIKEIPGINEVKADPRVKGNETPFKLDIVAEFKP